MQRFPKLLFQERPNSHKLDKLMWLRGPKTLKLGLLVTLLCHEAQKRVIWFSNLLKPPIKGIPWTPCTTLENYLIDVPLCQYHGPTTYECTSWTDKQRCLIILEKSRTRLSQESCLHIHHPRDQSLDHLYNKFCPTLLYSMHVFLCLNLKRWPCQSKHSMF